MPIEPRPEDAFTQKTLLLGFSVIEFTKTKSSVPIPLKFLASQTLNKEINQLDLEQKNSGLNTRS
jgi:hypothetical protein